MANRKDASRNAWMLNGSFARKGYDWWWHSFTGRSQTTGKERSFFVEYFTVNPALGGSKPVLGQLPANRENGLRPSYLMVKAGWWGEDHAQLHRFFGWDDVKIHAKAPYSVETGDCFASDTRLKGQIRVTAGDAATHPEYMCDAGEMSWDLRLDKRIAFNVGYGASRFFRAIKAFEMYWHAEGIKTLMEGTVTCNGETYVIAPDTSFGYSDKNWGRNFTSPWVWLSSCNLTDTDATTGKRLENSAFDIGGGRPKVFCLPLERQLLSQFTYEGKDYEFNFSKFWTGCRTEFKVSEEKDCIRWHVRQETRTAIMITDITCPRKEMLWANYEAPDGSRRHTRLWNGGTGSGTVQLIEKRNGQQKPVVTVRAENIGCEYGEYGH